MTGPRYADNSVVEADIADAVFLASGNRRSEEQADTLAKSTAGTARTTRDDHAQWQPVLAGPRDPAGSGVRRSGGWIVMGVALAHA